MNNIYKVRDNSTSGSSNYELPTAGFSTHSAQSLNNNTKGFISSAKTNNSSASSGSQSSNPLPQALEKGVGNTLNIIA